MDRRLSCFPAETARDQDQHDQHGDAGNDEVAQDGAIPVYVADEDRTDAHVAVDSGVSDEGKLPAREAPGERCATDGKDSEKPHHVTLAIEDPREQCPKENVGRDIQIGAEEMRFQAAALEYGPGDGDDQAIENCILPVRCVLM